LGAVHQNRHKEKTETKDKQFFAMGFFQRFYIVTLSQTKSDLKLNYLSRFKAIFYFNLMGVSLSKLLIQKRWKIAQLRFG
jgi:hypothetical protein